MARHPILSPCWLLPLLAAIATAQQVDTATPPVRTLLIYDEIQNLQERRLFKEFWETEDPKLARQRATDFVVRYPRSILLREAYELAARTSVSLGDSAGALEWGKRALRLLPENPFLLTMMADIAARQGQHQMAETSGRQALRFLEGALAPVTVKPEAWPEVRDGLRNTASFALGRTAMEQGRSADAERYLLDAVRLKPADYVALYALGVARTSGKDPDSAAACFAEVMKKASGQLAEAGRQRLRQIYAAQKRSQTFEDFAAAQQWSLPPAVTPAAGSPGVYAGSAACGECHAAEFRNWQATGMAKMFRPYSANDVMGNFSGQVILGGTVRTSSEKGQRFIELREGNTDKWRRYRVDALIGSKWQQAYASLLADGRLVVLPVQYSKVEGGWVNYWKIVDGSSQRSDIVHFKGTPDGSLYQRDCAPCHTSQLHYEGAGALPVNAKFREGGIDCEMCHGPSQAHVDAMNSGPAGARPATSGDQPPVNFRKIPAEQSVAICNQCHKQSLAHEPDAGGAVNFAPGDGTFYRRYNNHLLSDYSHKIFYADGRYKVTTFIGEAFERSRCFLDGGATCVSCHNPHPGDAAKNDKSLKFAADSDEMCTQCHKALREQPEKHTRHAAGSQASRCVSCHMPKNMESLMFRARSHQIDEIPDAEMTTRFGKAESPNACLDCHRDKDVRWLNASMAARRSSR